MNTDDLFRKIGVLTVENDMLREVLGERESTLRKVTKERDDLLAVSREPEADLTKVAEEENHS